MSGHSKWSTIKRQKGAADIKRGQIFTKLSNAITLAVKQGGSSDPGMNFKLRLVIDSAKAVNMPKDNIDRAIERASGKGLANVEELIYEGFGPGGFSVIVETATDNKQRTVSEVKNIFDKNGGAMGAQGSVSYQYEQKGLIITEKNDKTLDDIFIIAAESGADDVEENGEEFMIYTKPDQLAKVREGIQSYNIPIVQAELIRKPTITVALSDAESAKKAINFLQKLEDLDDVQRVYSNVDIPENIAID